MSKFNTQATGYNENKVTYNREGAVSFKVDDAKVELANLVLTAMLKGDSFYESDVNRIEKVFKLVDSLDDPIFAAKAMIYTRQVGNLRSISHILAAALVEKAAGNTFVRNAIRKAIVRPDDITEMASLWFSRHPDKMLPNSMRRAFKDVLESETFNAFQLRRYSGVRKNVKLKDIVKLVHPRDSKGFFGDILNDSLSAEKSLETRLASGESAAEAFSDLLRTKKLGYMAAVKNIRNALKTGLSDEDISLWCDLITNPVAIKKSRMLPFRYVDCWNAVKESNINEFSKKKVRKAINTALKISAQNLNIYTPGERIAIIVDESGSMMGGWGTSGWSPWNIAITLAAVLTKAFGSKNIIAYKFGSTATRLDFSGKDILSIIEGTDYGGGATYFSKPLELMTSTKTKVDKIIMLTDMQLYSENIKYTYFVEAHEDTFLKYLNKYKVAINPKVKVLFWNLEGYTESTPLQLRKDVLMASGFSDKLLILIPKLWKDQNALVNEIELISI